MPGNLGRNDTKRKSTHGTVAKIIKREKKQESQEEIPPGLA